MASIIGFSSCIACFFPQSIFSFDGNALIKETFCLLDSINDPENRFDNLEKSVIESNAPLVEGRRFIESFLQELELQHGIMLTLQEACQLVKANLYMFQIPEEARESLLVTVNLLLEEALEPTHLENWHLSTQCECSGIDSALQKSWDCLRGKKHRKKERYCQTRVVGHNLNLTLPGNVYVGGVEMFSGVLVCLLPFPGSARIGVAMIVDGGRRVIDGYIQADDEERLRRTYPDMPNLKQ